LERALLWEETQSLYINQPELDRYVNPLESQEIPPLSFPGTAIKTTRVVTVTNTSTTLGFARQGSIYQEGMTQKPLPTGNSNSYQVIN
jgi:hypothetical protein